MATTHETRRDDRRSVEYQALLERGKVSDLSPVAGMRGERDWCRAWDLPSSGQLLGGPHDCTQDADIGAALAQVAGKRLPDLLFRRPLGRRQERRRLHDHAVDSLATLRGLLVDERLLQRMRLLRRPETFERD